MSCKKIQVLISRNLDNDLNIYEKRILEKHLFACSNCRKKARQFSNIKNLFKRTNSIDIINRNHKIKNKKNNMIIKTISGIAALIIFIFLISFYNFNKKNKIAVKNNYITTSTINYPLASIDYYEQGSLDNYKSVYYVPMSKYYYSISK